MNSIIDMIKKFHKNGSYRAYLEKIRWNNKPCCLNVNMVKKTYTISPFSYK